MVQIVEVHSGLANRMFEYAFYRSLKYKGLNARMYDNYKVKEWKFEDVSLEKIFDNIQIEKVSTWDSFKLGGGNDIFSRFVRNRLKFSRKSYVLCPAEQGFNADLYSLKHSAFHHGFYQSERYFEDIKDEIRLAFQFKPFEDGRNNKLKLEMSNCESVVIHIRKGADYLRNKKVLNTCSIDYYINAVNYIRKLIENPVFYVFTDNKDWAKENLNFIEYTLVDWNPTSGPSNYVDMQLMSCAKHNIIANSSYSWWGAWLNSNKNKVVIGPKFWYNPDCKEYYKKDIEILPTDWICL